jgi:enoyl-CoA hydratase
MHEIRMQHPGKNALGTGLIGWLEEELRRAGDEPLLLTGTGDAFSAGLDLKEVHAADHAAMETMLRRLDALFARLFQHPAPTVACVNGHAIAGGCILMMCCDWRIATDDPKARIGINEVALGACVPPMAAGIVKHRLPPQARERIVLGAGLHAPEAALALGLVDEVVNDPATAALKRLQALAAYPPATYAVTKRSLRSGLTVISAEDEHRFREQEVPIWTSREVKERVAAVLRR